MTTILPASDPSSLANPSHLAEGFHTAFRKGMDSPCATVVHGIIGWLDHKVFDAFVRHLAAAVEDAGRLDAGVLREACLDWDPFAAFGKNETRHDQARVLSAALKTLPPRAWAEISSFLTFDPSDWKKERPREAESGIDADWLALVEDGMRPRMHVVLAPSGESERAYGEIRVVEVVGEPDERGRRKPVIVGYEPTLYGHPRIPLPAKNGFPTIEEAYAACRERLVEAARAKGRLERARLRSHDEAWAGERLPAMVAACRFAEGLLQARSLEGFNVRRALHGVEAATKAYNEARERPTPDEIKRSSYDELSLALRLESYLRDLVDSSRPDSRLGFAARYAVHGEAAALRAFKGRSYHGVFMEVRDGGPNRPEALLEVLKAEAVPA